MKKTLSIILSLILALGVIVGIGVSAYAEESEVFTLPNVTVNEETYLSLEDMGISDLVSQIREHFPEKIEEKYENGVLSIPNVQAASASYFSFVDYNDHEMTLVDGYWTLEIEESVYNDGFGLIRYYGIDEEWQAAYRQGYMECITIRFFQDRVVQIYPTFTTLTYVNLDDLLITNEYDQDGALTINSVRFDSDDLTVIAYYKPNREFQYAEIMPNGLYYYYLPNQGWSSNRQEYQPVDIPEGYEEIDEEYILSIAPCSIPCEHPKWTDETKSICAVCGKVFFNLDGVLYEVLDDVTYKGLELSGRDDPTTLCYKAGEGYIVAKLEKHDAQIILYNATIDVSEITNRYGIYTSIEHVEYIIYGTNNIYGNNNKYTVFSSGASSESSEITMTGIDDGVLNIYGEYHGNYLIINSGVVNVYNIQDSGNTIVAVDILKKLTINEGATLTAVSTGAENGFNIGVLASRGIENNGTLNATYLTGTESDNELIYNIVISGDVVLYNDVYNLFMGEEIPDGMIVEFNLIILDGARVTVPAGVTLNLDSMTKVDVQGKIIVEGTLICTHEGGEATCTDNAICDICKTSYIEALGHEYDSSVTAPDCENNGYTTYTCNVCGYSHNADETEALGHDFEKGECTVCGEEDPDLNWFERIVYIIINFFKRVFEFLTKK